MTTQWPADTVASEHEADVAALQTPELVELESEICAYLDGSWCSEAKARLLLELVVLTSPGVCVDVGTFTGSTALPILAGLRHLDHGRAYLIDAWSNEEAVRGLPTDDVNTAWWAGVDMATVRSQFEAMLAQWSLAGWCEVLAEDSRGAAARIEQIDLLHLDGSFSEEGSVLDSELYLPKVLPGGYVALSNVLVTVGGIPTKMKALWPLFDCCEIVCELDGGNTLLFRKR